MQSSFSFLLLLTSLLSLSSALTFPRLPHLPSLAIRQTPSSLAESQAFTNGSVPRNSSILVCENLLDNGLNQTCWDTLNMTGYMKNWNKTNEANGTCEADELWANCFMRTAGLTVPSKLGCGQVGPNTCPEPTADDLLLNDAYTAYGIYNIWSLQNLYTSIYNDLTGANSTTIINSAWNNLTHSQQKDADGKSFLASIFFATDDPRTDILGDMAISLLQVPFTHDIKISKPEEAQKVLADVLATYLLYTMTNYTYAEWPGESLFAQVAAGGILI